MKLTTFILIIALTQVSAKSFSQISLHRNHTTLAAVLKTIKQQTGFVFVSKDVDLNDVAINIDVKNATINEALDACFKNIPISYSIIDKTIVLTPRELTTFEKIRNALNAIDVRGQVLDEKRQPIAGATVRLKNANQATATDKDGYFYLRAVDEHAVIVINVIGYLPKEIPAAENIGAIELQVSNSKLEEVSVNAGYYSVKERDRTGSISAVSSQTIAEQPVTNVLGAIIGRMPGVNVQQTSGVNGGGFTVEIRGRNSLRTNSLNNGNRPLYLVDGIPYPAAPITNSDLNATGDSFSPLNYINPADIESIEVLKDADATAIYGSRGSNGVILITTKKAKTGKTSVDVNFNEGISQIDTKLKLLNTPQYLMMRREALKNDGVATPASTDYDINGTFDQSRYTDWQKTLIGGHAANTNLQTSINGGNEFTQFVFRGNYNRQTTVYPGDFADQRGSGALSVNHSSADKKFKVNFSATYIVDRNALPQNDLTQFIQLAPDAPALYDANGNLNWALNSGGSATWNNPLAYTRQQYVGLTKNFISSGLINYEIIPGLSLRTSLGYTNLSLNENLQRPISSFAPSATATGENVVSTNNLETWIIEPQINYKRKIGQGTLDALIGSTFQSNNQSAQESDGSNYASDLLLGSLAAAPSITVTNSASLYKYNALFGRINYNYKDKYLLNITGRRDGSSRFGPGKQFANFGAIGGAWIFGDENYVRDLLPALSFGKLRGSYGITGSDQIPNYGYFESYSSSLYPYRDGSGLVANRIANSNFSWETNKKLDVALELGFVNDRIMFSADWYRNRSSNQLVGYPLPDITGFTTIQYNLPATVQNTGWEFEINTYNVSTKTFKWKSNFNITIPQNKLLSYPNIAASSYANTYTVGQSIYTPRAYHYLGVDPTTGKYIYTDVNGNGTYENADKMAAAKALTSHFYGGLTNSFNYKSFSLEIFVQFTDKTALNPLYLFSNAGANNKNQPTIVLNRWQQPGDQTDIQKFTQKFGAGSAGAAYTYLSTSDHFSDASFIRLKNVSFSWNAPPAWLKKVKLTNLRLFIQGQNLFTATSYLADPETTTPLVLPTLSTVTAGLDLTL